MKDSSSLKLWNSAKNSPIKAKLSLLLLSMGPSKERLSETSLISSQSQKKLSNFQQSVSIAPNKLLLLLEPLTLRKSNLLEEKSHTSQFAESVISHNSKPRSMLREWEKSEQSPRNHYALRQKSIQKQSNTENPLCESFAENQEFKLIHWQMIKYIFFIPICARFYSNLRFIFIEMHNVRVFHYLIWNKGKYYNQRN